MSTEKWTKQSSLIKENSVNVIEGIEESMAATRIRQTSNQKQGKTLGLITPRVMQQGY